MEKSSKLAGPPVEAHPTIGGGAVVRLNKEAVEQIRAGLKRMDQTFISVGPMMIELAKALQGLGEQLDPQVAAALGMTPDGGYKEPLADHLFINSLGQRTGDGQERCGWAKSQDDASGPCWRTREEHPTNA